MKIIVNIFKGLYKFIIGLIKMAYSIILITLKWLVYKPTRFIFKRLYKLVPTKWRDNFKQAWLDYKTLRQLSKFLSRQHAQAVRDYYNERLTQDQLTKWENAQTSILKQIKVIEQQAKREEMRRKESELKPTKTIKQEYIQEIENKLWVLKYQLNEVTKTQPLSKSRILAKETRMANIQKEIDTLEHELKIVTISETKKAIVLQNEELKPSEFKTKTKKKRGTKV